MRELQVDDQAESLPRQAMKHDHLVDAVEQLGLEGVRERLLDGRLHRRGSPRLRPP